MADLTLALTEKVFQPSIGAIVRHLTYADEQPPADAGAFRVGYAVNGHLDNGKVDFRDDGTVHVKELHFKWETLRLDIEVDLPPIGIGGQTITVPQEDPFGDLTLPFGDLTLTIPAWFLFTGDPDIAISPDLATAVKHEISFAGLAEARYWDPDSPPLIDAACAALHQELAELEIEIPDSNPPETVMPFEHRWDRTQWHIHVMPEWIDVDPVDVADGTGDMVEEMLANEVMALLPDGPDRDLALAAIGDVGDFLRFVLDIPDDFDEWLSDLLDTSLGVSDFIQTSTLQYLGDCIPVYGIEDPYQIMRRTAEGLIPVKIPIEKLKVAVDDDEMTVTADIGVLP